MPDLETTTPSYNFDKLEPLSIEEGEFIAISTIEPCESKRIIKYKGITHQRKDIITYKLPENGNIIKRVKYTNKLYGKKAVLDRRLNWEKFGLSDGNLTNITYDNPVTLDFTPKKLINVKKRFSDKPPEPPPSIKRGFIISSKPPPSELLNIKPKKFKGYIPTSIKKDLEENKTDRYSIIVRNIPLDEDGSYIENSLYDMFKSYGLIDKIKILRNKQTDRIKDMVFVDFMYMRDAVKLLNSSEKFKINRNILSLEKSKTV